MDLGDTNLTIFSKANPTAITKTAIGGGLAKTANTMYDLFIFCTPGGQLLMYDWIQQPMPQEL